MDEDEMIVDEEEEEEEWTLEEHNTLDSTVFLDHPVEAGEVFVDAMEPNERRHVGSDGDDDDDDGDVMDRE